MFVRLQSDDLADETLKDSAIARSFCRSRNAVLQYLNNLGTPRTSKRLGQTQKLSHTAQRALVREATKHSYTASELHHATGVNASLGTVQRVLHADENLQWKRLKA